MAKLPDFVLNKILGCLCTCDSEGKASGATVFYAVKDNKLYITTHKASQKAQDVLANPNVCLVVLDEAEFEQAQISATARIVENPQAYLELVEKTIAVNQYKTAAKVPYKEIKSEGHIPVVIELTPETIKYFKSGQGLVVT